MRVRARHLHGMFPEKQAVVIDIGSTGFRFWANKKTFVDVAWDQVDQFSIEDPHRTKANIGALMIFGVLGLAVRQDYTLLYFKAGARSAWFEAPERPMEWQSFVDQVHVEVPQSREKIFVGDEQPAVASTDIPAQIKALADLRDQGVLTGDEFESKKAELLARM